MTAQLRTDDQTQQGEASVKAELTLLNQQQEQWITFCALGGLITEESDDPSKPYVIKQMTVTEFANHLGVGRRTLYDWKRSIPNFSERMRARRYEVFSLSRETAAFNRLYLIGMTGKGQPAVQALTTLLGHFSRLDLPVQRQEVDVSNNLIDLVNMARKKNIIEGQTVGQTQPPASA